MQKTSNNDNIVKVAYRIYNDSSAQTILYNEQNNNAEK